MTLVTGEMYQTLQRIYICASWCKGLPAEIKITGVTLCRTAWYWPVFYDIVLFHGITMVLYAITMVLYGFDLH